ncbi:MAG: helix-turn-helix domain-containing protein [Treponema sp.]|nr:helix-turn-helix domain-containing protein [Treponema sp.]
MKFRENLKELLIFQDMQVKELAVLSGVKKRTIDNYLRESGAEPSAENAVKIAGALGVTVEYLVTGKHPGLPETGGLGLAELRTVIKQVEKLNGAQRKALITLLRLI